MDQTEVVNRRLELQGGHGIRHRGHPLDMSRDAAIRDAALDLLSEIGYDRLTMDAVAARAHASKATIYRRWQGKAALVVDALNCSKGSMVEPDTGSLEGDFAALGQGSCSQESRFNAQIMLGLITALAHDVELRDVVRERMIEPRTNVIRTDLRTGGRARRGLARAQPRSPRLALPRADDPTSAHHGRTSRRRLLHSRHQ